MRAPSPSVMILFFQNVILKVTLSQLCSKFLLNNYAGHDNNMLTTALWMIPGSFREWIMIHANYFIKTWVNIMKQKSTKLPWKLSLSKKKTILHFNKHCIEIKDISTIVIRFFFVKLSNKPSFLSNPVFIGILDSCCHVLFTFLRFYYWYSFNFGVHPEPLFIRTSKILMMFNTLFI